MSNHFNIKKYLKTDEYIYNEGIYDFLNNEKHYSDSFAFEYEKFSKIQFDSFNNSSLTKDRLIKSINWSENELENKDLLEVGSGNGRFTEILLDYKSNLITFDSSNAIFQNYKHNISKIDNNKNFFVKADIYNLPFIQEKFDYIFCCGVLQNTQNPLKTLEVLIPYLKKNGKMALDVTKKNKFYFLNPKYFWRNFTVKLNKEILFKIVNFYVRKFYNIDAYLKNRFGFFGRILSKILLPLPLLSSEKLNLSQAMKIDFSVLDTFDCLASAYDNPLTKRNIQIFLNNLLKKGTIKIGKIIENQNLFIIHIEK